MNNPHKMSESKKKRLEAAGYKIGDAEDFLKDLFGENNDEKGTTKVQNVCSRLCDKS